MLTKPRFFLFLFLTSASICLFAQQRMTPEEYITKYKNIAVREMEAYGIPASITLAQGMLESDYGNSPLSLKAKNHFGIKCTSDWKGKSYHQDDDAKNECFRKYNREEDSFIDHSEFLKNRPHYASLFELDRNDYKGWAYGLKKAGYATNPKYPQLLINLIEKYSLHAYDHKGNGANTHEKQTAGLQELTEHNGVKYVTVPSGETLLSLATQYNIWIKRLMKYNDLDKKSAVKPGDRIYVQPKRRRGSERYHIVRSGETMHSISQEYGIKLKMLYKRNRMPRGTQAAPGERLWLKGKRKKAPQPDTRQPTKVKYKYHTVDKGDTLYSVSKKYGLTVEELKKMNNLSNDSLEINQKLIIGY